MVLGCSCYFFVIFLTSCFFLVLLGFMGFSVVFGCSWLFLCFVINGYWLFLVVFVVFCGSWLFMVDLNGYWRSLVVLGGSWWLFVVSCGSWWFLVVL